MYRSQLIGLVALCAASGAMADDRTAMTTTDVRLTFEAVDRNADLRISKTEAGSHKSLIDRFASVDSDGDGFISRPEFEARPSNKDFE